MSNKWFPIVGIWIQIIIWVVFLLMPLAFMSPNFKLTISSYLISCVPTINIMIVFYLNYLVFSKMLARGEIKKVIAVNIIFILMLSVMQHEIIYHTWNYIHDDDPIELKTPTYMRILWVVRNIIIQSITAVVANSIRFSLQWSKTQRARQEAELANLRSQINPHFLLNTLNNIYALTAFNSAKAQEAIVELSKLLRHVLYNGQKQYVSLKDEATFIQHYINLMKLRISKNVEITENYDIPEPCYTRIAPMIIISLVENAFKHGISPGERNFIHISISADDKQIKFQIENSNHPKDQKDRSGHGIGLQQVARRLEMLYPGKYEWTKGVNINTKTYNSKLLIYDTKLRNH